MSCNARRDLYYVQFVFSNDLKSWNYILGKLLIIIYFYGYLLVKLYFNQASIRNSEVREQRFIIGTGKIDQLNNLI